MKEIGNFVRNNTVAVLVGLAVLGVVLAWLDMGQGVALIAMVWGSILMFTTGRSEHALQEDDETA